MSRCEIKISREPLGKVDPRFSRDYGGVVDFYGVVRALENDHSIEGIDYEAFVPMAEIELKKIALAAADDFSLGEVVIHHRIGFVSVGEPSLFLRVSARHRGAAFAASARIIEQLKAVVPIWKHAIYSSVQIA
jgi:molybdopterin synthase catalytic subunit